MANVPLPSVNWPLSGAVTQTFFPWVNIEKEILPVASYGKQLGRIGEALIALLRHLPDGVKLRNWPH